MSNKKTILWFNELGLSHLDQVGGKNASLGEMIQNLAAADVNVPPGFATTAEAFSEFLEQNQLNEKISARLASLDIEDLDNLSKVGREIRQLIVDAPLLPQMASDIREAYAKLTQEVGDEATFAVRSSATAEDLPDASFAGQQETFLNIKGEENILLSVKHVFASLYNDRAIAYRVHHGFDHQDVAISAGIQRMIRSDLAASGVMFTLDTESGFDGAVLITASYGLGEAIVQGAVNPDEIYVYKENIKQHTPAIIRRHLGSKLNKMVYGAGVSQNASVMTTEVPEAERNVFSISDTEAEVLARYAIAIEDHYQRPMDIEWAKDGLDGKLYILQARPETVKSRESSQVIERFELLEQGDVIATGRSIGQRIGQGKAKIIKQLSELSRVNEGDVLVSDMTDPDWEPVMKKASAIVTNRGGRTCHAAIIARELGIPAVVGCGDATSLIKDGQEVTVSCAEGEEGRVYRGQLRYEINRIDVESMPELPLKVMLNVANPDRAFAFSALPHRGVGLARLEFIINNMIGIHPKALLNFSSLDAEYQTRINEKISAYASPTEFYIEKLREGIATLAVAFAPEPVIVRLSDFKSNEYANLLGGELFEPKEENPMLGFRGASRYYADSFRDCFALECEAIKRVRNDMGLRNVEVMVPFVRTVSEAANICDILADNGLERGKDGLRLIMMCEIPSNALLADAFLNYFDGFSIGSNDLTQLTLGLDRDSELVAKAFDERNDAVKALLKLAIDACLKQNKYVGICGQGPSDHKNFALWLLEAGIQSVSLNPDSVLDTCLYLAKQTKQKVAS